MSITFSTAARHRIQTRVRKAALEKARASGFKTTADLLTVTANAIRQWDTGRVLPSFNMARRIAPILGLNPDTGEPVAGASS